MAFQAVYQTQTKENQMIPKQIHYCWFGRKPLPESARRCIDSWRRFMPGYEIVEWNEDNFDVDMIPYASQAYKSGKYAFVSDYARFWILYHHGGVYFDTDVEVIRPLDEILSEGPFMGCEKTISGAVAVAPGLGIAAEPQMPVFQELMDMYSRMQFLNEDGSLNTVTVVKYTTDILSTHGFVPEDRLQVCAGLNIWPVEYFCPVDYRSGKCTITPNTYTIHHYAASWHSAKDKWAMLKRRFFTERQIRAISAFLDRWRKR